MADIDYITLRAATTTRALSTLGASPEWDRALIKFLRLQALSLSNDEFGPYAKANNHHDWEVIRIEQQYGRNWREVPAAVERHATAYAQVREAEEAQAGAYGLPMWEAERELVAVPAPNLNAALFKAETIAAEEVWNDSKFEADAFKIVSADFARLAGEAA